MNYYHLPERHFETLSIMQAQFSFYIDLLGTKAYPENETRVVNINDLGWLFWMWNETLMAIIKDIKSGYTGEEELEEAV